MRIFWTVLYAASVLFLCSADLLQDSKNANKWFRCGEAHWCFRRPAQCSLNDCEFAAVVGPSPSPEYLRFRVVARNAYTRPYLAVRFSEVAHAKQALVVFCSPRDDLLRLAREVDGRFDYGDTKVGDDALRMIDSSIGPMHLMCEFERIIAAPKGRLASYPLNRPQFLQFSTGAILDNGFPETPFGKFDIPKAVNFSATPVVSSKHKEKGNGTSIGVRATEENIPKYLIKDVPVVSETDIPDEPEVDDTVRSEKDVTEDLHSRANVTKESTTQDEVTVVEEETANVTTEEPKKEEGGSLIEVDGPDSHLDDFDVAFFMGMGTDDSEGNFTARNDSYLTIQRALVQRDSDEDFDGNISAILNDTGASNLNDTQSPSGCARVLSLWVLPFSCLLFFLLTL